jgi:hypothetical protein
LVATRYVAAQTVATPYGPIALEISGNLAIDGDLDKEDSTCNPGDRWVGFKIPTYQYF